MEGKRVLIDWGYMAYLEGGRGRPLVFVHGAGNSIRVWDRVLMDLKKNYRVLAVDLPGHGESSCKLEETVEGYAARVIEFLDALNLQDVHLVGHSMGGAIVVKAVPQCSRVTGAVLVGTGATLEVNPTLLKGLKENFGGSVDMMARWSFSREVPQDLVDEAREMMLQVGREVLYRDMYACSVYSGEEDLSSFSVPTLVVCGEKDVMTPPRLSQKLAEEIEGARLVLVPGSGHMVHLERPRELVGIIRSFLP
nr:esterase/lipase [uncultured bacterium]